MLVYLIKSGVLLAIFLAVYKWVLEPTPMPQFNRFYLLLSLIASLSIPLMVFTSVSYVEVQETAQLTLMEIDTTEAEAALGGLSLIHICLWTIYGLGFGLFFLKFILNLYQIIREITLNPKKRKGNFINVLLDKDVSPHTFLNYIFFNKYSFEAGIIPDEVFWHEETHARQYHSLDILIVEFIQVIFWFNPLIYLTQKAIKLNHEYLADQAVLAKGVPMRNYLQTLLTFAQFKDPLSLTHSLQQSPIKKRFALMKTIKNKRTMMFKSLLVLPLFSILLYSFSKRETLEIQKAFETPIPTSPTLFLEASALDASAVSRYKTLYTAYEKQRTANPHFIHRSEEEQATLLATNATLGGLYFRLNKEDKTLVNRPIHPAQPYISLVEDGKRVYKLKSEMTAADNNLLPPPPPAASQDKATPAQVARYNKLAKKYKAMIKAGQVQVKEAELTEMRKIFAIMSTEQKKNAETFPQLPPPPPPPPAPPVIKKGGDNPQNIPPPPPPNPLDHIIDLAKKGASFYYEGKKVSSDVLIDKLKKNENLQIQVREEHSKNPKVYVKKVSQLNGSSPEIEEIIEVEEVEIEVIEKVDEVEIEVMEVIEEVEEVEEPLVQEIIEVIEEVEVAPYEVVEEIVEEEIIVEIPAFLAKLKQNPQDKTGYKTIKGEIFYFITNKNGTRYFNRFGKETDSNGKLK